ncbi:MAG: reductase [Firmicutes bacterium]|nr:reductase [Bacillota bacterium]
MKVLVLGGTRFFGVETVRRLIADGHEVTLATRGLTPDTFGNDVLRIKFDHLDKESVCAALGGKYYDAVVDKIAFSSNDVKRILDAVECKKYVLMSTSGVYPPCGTDIKETAFDPLAHSLKWGERDWSRYGHPGIFDYDEGKKQAEAALAQAYPHINGIMLRYSVVIGENDYTKRLLFYVEHVLYGTSMYISNPDTKICFYDEKGAGGLIADVLKTDITGPFNACCDGCVSLSEITAYIEKKTGKRAVLDKDGDPAPYNGFTGDYTLCTQKAKDAGLHFVDINDRLWELLDKYIYSLKK